MPAGECMVIRDKFEPLLDAAGDGGAAGGAGAPQGGAPQGDDPMKQAAFERDQALARAQKFERELAELRKLLPSDDERKEYQELRAARETAEEERKKKAGEFDAWRSDIEKKNLAALKAKDDEITAARNEATSERKLRHDAMIAREFAEAAELFGASETALTVLPAQIAQSHFGRFVTVEKDDQTGREVIVVKDEQGVRPVDPATGRPHGFINAMREIIEKHPLKDHILRGSGKVGSGSAGGHGSNKPLDLGELTRRAATGDKAALAELKQRRSPGGIVMGEAYS